MSVNQNLSRRPVRYTNSRARKVKVTPERERFDATFLSLLQFANAHLASCIYFEPPIEDDEMALRAFRIMLDVWDDVDTIEKFVQTRPPVFKGVDYELAKSWEEGFIGPMVCMETAGSQALILCEGRVFSARSIGRSWSDMVSHTPDVIVTGLLPYDESIIGSGLILRRCGRFAGPGVDRVRQEFEEGKRKGVIEDAEHFIEAARQIKAVRRTQGLDPTLYRAFTQVIAHMNSALGYASFPYLPKVGIRPWSKK